MSDPWQPQPDSDGNLTPEGAIFQALGTASVCWTLPPDSQFDSGQAEAVGDGLIAYLREHPLSGAA